MHNAHVTIETGRHWKLDENHDGIETQIKIAANFQVNMIHLY